MPNSNVQGSGFFIAKSLLVTNYHVIKNSKDRVVNIETSDGGLDLGFVVLTDPDNDIALIQSPTVIIQKFLLAIIRM